MDSVPNEEIELLSVSAAAGICKIDRHYIADGMNQYAASNGRLGLAFVMMPSRKLSTVLVSPAILLARMYAAAFG